MTAIHLPPGGAGHHRMIGGDHVARADIHGPCGPLEDGAGGFLVDVAGSALPDQPVAGSMGAILRVSQRRGVTLAGA